MRSFFVHEEPMVSDFFVLLLHVYFSKRIDMLIWKHARDVFAYQIELDLRNYFTSSSMVEILTIPVI